MSDPLGVDTNKRWFKVPGDRRPSDRTVQEQMIGVEHALAEAKGKTVLDLGCAEGLISLEFAKAGATKVVAVEYLNYHLDVARVLCKDHPVECVNARIEELAKNQTPPRYDIVLALSVLHKLVDVPAGLDYVARSSSGLVVFRWPQWYDRANNILRSKHHMSDVRVHDVMKGHGFERERWIYGPPRHEAVEYWRRK